MTTTFSAVSRSRIRSASAQSLSARAVTRSASSAFDLGLQRVVGAALEPASGVASSTPRMRAGRDQLGLGDPDGLVVAGRHGPLDLAGQGEQRRHGARRVQVVRDRFAGTPATACRPAARSPRPGAGRRTAGPGSCATDPAATGSSPAAGDSGRSAAPSGRPRPASPAPGRAAAGRCRSTWTSSPHRRSGSRCASSSGCTRRARPRHAHGHGRRRLARSRSHGAGRPGRCRRRGCRSAGPASPRSWPSIRYASPAAPRPTATATTARPALDGFHSTKSCGFFL